jgi:hypothetical protein
MGNAQVGIAELHQRTADNIRAMPIGVGFDGRPERTMAYQLLEQTQVMREVLKMDRHLREMSHPSIHLLYLWERFLRSGRV